MKQEETLANPKPMQDRKYLVSYMGSSDHAPHEMRQQMASLVVEESKRLGFKTFIGHASDWREVMRESRASLTPRGFGRTAYHVVETLQMGLVPIHIFTDTPWVPYPELFDRLGYVVSVAHLPELLVQLSLTNNTEFSAREDLIRQYRTS